MSGETPPDVDRQATRSGSAGLVPPGIVWDEQTRQRIQTICLVVLAVLAATYLIFWLRPVLVPFVVALFVVSGLSPILAMLERTLGVTRIVAAAITFLAGVAMLVVFGCTIWISISDLASNSQAYVQRVKDIAREIEEHSPVKLNLRIHPTAAEASDTKEQESERQFAETMVRQGITMVSQSLVNFNWQAEISWSQRSWGTRPICIPSLFFCP